MAPAAPVPIGNLGNDTGEGLPSGQLLKGELVALFADLSRQCQAWHQKVLTSWAMVPAIRSRVMWSVFFWTSPIVNL
jgi:hypothetical protein